ncbi:MAG: alginate export family protein [Chitinophagales bacterium]
MKKKLTKSILSIVFTLLASQIFSQFVISAEYRPRAEYRDGYKKLNTMNDAPAFFVSQRTRLNLTYKTNRFKTYLSLQDVRTWGNQKQFVANEANAFSVNQAWGEVFFAKSNVFSMKFGRQAISLDNQRIFGAVNWAQQARSHDALIFKYSNPKILSIQLGVAYNQNMGALTNTSYTLAGSYKTFQYLWLNKKLLKNKLSISFLLLNKGDEVRNDYNNNGNIDKGEYWDNYSQTLGTYIQFKKDKFSTSLHAYYQTGKVAEYRTDLGPRNISALNIGLDLNYKIYKNLTLFAGYEYMTGQSQTDTTTKYNNTIHAFNPFFGTNHKFNGFMDYFYVGNHMNNVGLQDIYFKLKYKNDKFNLGADYHAFLSSAEIKNTDISITDPTQKMSNYLGSEIDLYVGFPITKGVKFNFVYTMMFGTKSMEAIKGGDRKQFNNYAYCEVIIKPVLFDSEKFMKKKLEKQIELLSK